MTILCIIVLLVIITTGVFSAVIASLSEYSGVNKKEVISIRNWIYVGIAVLTVTIGLFSSIYNTNEQEIGFTSVFGKNTLIEGTGIHFKAPFVSKKYVYDATVQGMAVGYTEDDSESVLEDSMMITSDFNFVNIDFYIEYRITNPIDYRFGTSDPEGILRNITQSAIRNTVGQYDVDTVMTTGKSEIEMKVFDDIVNELEKHHTGLEVTNVTIQDSEPPTTAVAAAFQAVEDAKQNAETVENKANEYKNTQIPAAEAEAEAVIQAADAAGTERVNAAKEEVATFEALYEEYSNNPETVKMRMYYDAIAEVTSNMDIVIGNDSKVIYVTSSTDDVDNYVTNSVGNGVQN